MTIAILVSGLPPERVGGAETQAAQLARYLAARHRVLVYTRTTPVPAELASLPNCTVIRRCDVDLKGIRFIADVVQTLRHLWLAKRDIDVIIAYQTVIDGFIGVLVKRFARVPVIVSVRSAMEYRVDHFLQSRLFTPFVFRRCDRIAVQSPLMAAELLTTLEPRRAFAGCRLRDRVSILPNGLEIDREIARTPETVLFVGRLEPVKGARFAIEAIRRCPGEQLVIVGDGPERQALEAQARDLSNVRFAGTLSTQGVRREMARAKMLLVPSEYEGQPNVIMEAMALGIPVIASRVGGIPELVHEGQTGFLVAPGDVEAISKSIEAIAADVVLRARIADNARVAIAPYAWANVIDAYERTLHEVTTSACVHHA